MKLFDQQLMRLKSMLGVTGDQDVAALLDMSKAAFSDRKKRDSFPEEKLRALVQRRPDLPIDVDYVLRGETARTRYERLHPGQPAGIAEVTAYAMQEALTPDEQVLLEAYRRLSATARSAVLVELLKGQKKPKTKPKAPSESAGIKVSGSGHRVAGRDYHEKE
ncbi:helix-turn-helix domain-containing protein [Pseudomonas aeruginosa]|jgi:hypothetical protein|uniref:helix-turn-helix domain-containing protein n=1 Tax=Pseudomonas aeruginosa TaxID=287 RepID=UPI002F3E941D